jgi:hypothetical protein
VGNEAYNEWQATVETPVRPEPTETPACQRCFTAAQINFLSLYKVAVAAGAVLLKAHADAGFANYVGELNLEGKTW